METGPLDESSLLNKTISSNRNKKTEYSRSNIEEADFSDDDELESSVSFGVLLSTFVAVCGSLTYGCAMGYTSVAMSGIMEDLGLSVADYSLFGSIMTFGGMIGAIFSGKTTALIGRRRTMWLSEIFCTIGWLAIAFAKDIWWLDIGRFSIGIGVGFFSYVVPVYISEITPKRIRGAFTFANQLMQNCGLSIMYVSANFINWRNLAFIGVIPCVIQAIGLFFIPESPRWLAKFGRKDELKESLKRLRRKNADISREATEIIHNTEMLEEGPKAKILDLFQRKYAKLLTVGIGLLILQQLTGIPGISSYVNTIFEKADFPSKVGTTTLAFVMIPKAILGLILVDKWGRRPLLLASTAGMCFSCLLLGFTFCLKSFDILNEITPILAFIGVLLVIMTFAMGMGGLPWIIMSEIFPINIKGSAGSLATLASWSSGLLITYTFIFMLEWNPTGTFFIYSCVCGATIVFVWFLVPETKSRTLEELQVSLLIDN